jgi:beta-galactosidase
MSLQKKLIFGADYYPEQWPESMWERDADRMKDFGVSSIRIMEFAWALVEPKKGRYDFSLFEKVISLFESKGISVVLGTPTATLPIWLYESDRTMSQIYADGTYRDFGTRRQACYNSKTYFKAAMNITEKCARRFGSNRNVTGWQIDNEIGHEGSDICVCKNCAREWPVWLKKKYQNVKKMNEVWGTVFWGTLYSDFRQVPQPKPQVMSIHNPGLILDYYRFCSDSAVKFARAQRDILKKIISPAQTVTTDLFSPSISSVIDFEDMFAAMDEVGMNNYPVWGDQNEPLPYIFSSYNLAYNRGLKSRENFTVFEQISGFQGHRCLGYHPPEGQVAAWTNQAAAHGADRIFYFRWRTAPYGQEQLCHGILDADDRINARYEALKKNISDNFDAHSRLAASELVSEACLIYDMDNVRIVRDNYLTKALYNSPTKFMQVGWEAETAKHYAPFSLFNVNCDVKSVKGADLRRYKIITIPVFQMADPQFVKEISQWVSEGGTLILGWRAGTRDMLNHSVNVPPPGLFAELAGVRVERFESLNETKVKIRIGIIPAKGESWADVLEPVTASVVARYSDPRKHYKGCPAVTVNSYGRGKVWYLGTTPGPLAMFLLYRKIFRNAGIKTSFKGFGLEILKRTDADGGTFRVAVNHTPKAKWAGFTRIPAWGMKILD